MADWTPTDAELYIKQSYNQVDLILPEDLVKVESILTFKVEYRNIIEMKMVFLLFVQEIHADELRPTIIIFSL